MVTLGRGSVAERALLLRGVTSGNDDDDDGGGDGNDAEDHLAYV